MFGRYAALLVLFAGCAQPKYAVVDSAAGASPPNNQEKLSCGLKFSASKFCLSWNWELRPTDAQVGSITFKVFRANLLDGSQVQVDFDSTPEVVLWMPSMGHGSSPTTVRRIDVGTYRAERVFFVMPGIWEIHFQFKKGEVIADESIVSITI